MKQKLWNKRIPTIIALGLLFVSIWVTSYLIQTGVIFVGRAGPDKTPQNINVSNITDSSFTLSFTTNAKTVAGLSVEEKGSSPFIVFDNRNKNSNDQTEFYSHFITVPDLKPETIYNFSILSSGETFLDDGKKYSVKTGAAISSPPPKQNPVTGKIILRDGKDAGDTIVELQVGGAQSITARTKDDGSFIIPTNSIRTQFLNNYFILEPNQELKIRALKQDMTASVTTLFKNSEAIPQIILTSNYDFVDTDVEEIPSLSSQLKIPTPKTRFGEISVLSPSGSESFIDSRPLFRGTALPNETVRITIESDPIKTEVIADGNGVWTFRPAFSLSAGQHKITIQSVDRFGVIKTISRIFIVFPSGSQVAESATPSATPTVTITQPPTPTPIQSGPTSTPIPTPTASPTFAPTTTPTPTIPPFITISPTQIPIVTPAPPGSTSSIILTAISVLLIFAGSALLFLL